MALANFPFPPQWLNQPGRVTLAPVPCLGLVSFKKKQDAYFSHRPAVSAHLGCFPTVLDPRHGTVAFQMKNGSPFCVVTLGLHGSPSAANEMATQARSEKREATEFRKI